MKIWAWLVVAVVACIALLVGAYMFDGFKFFRNIQRAEELLYVGWAVVGVVGVIVPVLFKAFKDDRKAQRAHERR